MASVGWPTPRQCSQTDPPCPRKDAGANLGVSIGDALIIQFYRPMCAFSEFDDVITKPTKYNSLYQSVSKYSPQNRVSD